MIKKFFELTLNPLNLSIVNRGLHLSNLEKIQEHSRLLEYIRTITAFKGGYEFLSLAEKAKSQLGQELFVLNELKFKRNGYFVEFGATNGITLSNTYLLEKDFGWSGILAEPAKCWHADLVKNRDCKIDTNCVWSDSNSTLDFNEVEVAELSTINAFNSSDYHNKNRESGKIYKVKSISLEDLLDKYNAPKVIDFLSIDTEGSEYAILKGFNFQKYKFNVISCEHNFTKLRDDIFSLLTSNGYIRKYEKTSKFDDWYVRDHDNK